MWILVSEGHRPSVFLHAEVSRPTLFAGSRLQQVESPSDRGRQQGSENPAESISILHEKEIKTKGLSDSCCTHDIDGDLSQDPTSQQAHRCTEECRGSPRGLHGPQEAHLPEAEHYRDEDLDQKQDPKDRLGRAGKSVDNQQGPRIQGEKLVGLLPLTRIFQRSNRVSNVPLVAQKLPPPIKNKEATKQG